MTRVLAIATALLAATGCRSREPLASSPVTILVLDEAKAPIAGAEIATGAGVIARTREDGRADVTASGAEGATFLVEVRCPSIYRSPNTPLAIRRLSNDAHLQAPEYVARCKRTHHTLVVAVRAVGGAHLPILHRGKEIARTDESGSASVLLEGEVEERIELLLATNDPKHAKLHPQNPAAAFEVSDRDEVKVFEVKFTEDKKAPPRIAPRRAPKAF